ncbi:hypothetical protein CVV43_01250 [Candidatus Saccharibacteria bacterium HGW-Saccharibacteria-1]|jgi:hypothetical protein|nr:MAG: hypothetical protein CVV43_01250 [Candidatus Saccharibacteria bacterium HGW-Saccharibacteria-1]
MENLKNSNEFERTELKFNKEMANDLMDKLDKGFALPFYDDSDPDYAHGHIDMGGVHCKVGVDIENQKRARILDVCGWVGSEYDSRTYSPKGSGTYINIPLPREIGDLVLEVEEVCNSDGDSDYWYSVVRPTGEFYSDLELAERIDDYVDIQDESDKQITAEEIKRRSTFVK